MNHVLRFLFFLLVVRPILLIVLGANVRHRQRLPARGPAILAANHNSHLDALVLISLFPLRQLHRIRPVAAVDYFFRNRPLRWFSERIIGVVPLDRTPKHGKGDPLGPLSKALEAGSILVLFPEGTRGRPEEVGEIRTGIAHVARRHPEVPIHPVFAHGLGKALPSGEALLVPFVCDIFVGEPLRWTGDRSTFMETLACRMNQLADEGDFPPWE